MAEGYMNVSAAIKVAERLLKEKADLFKKIDTVRSDLRNAVIRKEANETEVKWIEETFPVRERPGRAVAAAERAAEKSDTETGKPTTDKPKAGATA
jgi:hypothetical protein